MTKPRSITVHYRGIPYELDLLHYRRALVLRQVEGVVSNMHSLAKAVGISRSTASRFISGRATSLAVTLRILNVLRLKFEEVARPLEEHHPQLQGWPRTAREVAHANVAASGGHKARDTRALHGCRP